VSVFSTSSYLKKEAVTKPITLTIAGHEKKNVGTDEKPDMKWVLSFEEIEEQLTLNKTRGEQLIEDFGSSEMDDWNGRQIEVYVDPSVKYAGKKVGGLAVKGIKA
jgi:hypothetical protein